MSEHERLDRARRIQELREGRRDEADDGDDPAEMDDVVAAAVDRVAGAEAEVPDPEQMGESIEEIAEAAETVEDATESDDVAAPAGVAESAESTEVETRVLEFILGEERYCLDIEYIEEIVKHEAITRVPNTPEYVEGVVDLRGQITTILNPKVHLETDETESGELLVVFDSEAFEEQGYLGWVVDDVRQVSPVTDEEVTDPPVEDDHVNGVIDREDDEEFVVWTSPELALEEAT